MPRVLLFLVLVWVAAQSLSAEDIAIVTCDVLLLVEVRVSGETFHFLVDTAATSMLNMKSFAAGETKTVSVVSWLGETNASARQVTISDLSLGNHHFRNLVLPAVDLSAIGRACGGQIDGILGIDLLRKLGAVLDLKDHVPRLRIDTETSQTLVNELNDRITSCEQAFNRGDESSIADCIDPEVVVFTSNGDFHGRAAAMALYLQQYSSQRFPAHLSIEPRAYHMLGEAMLIEYEFRVEIGEKTGNSRATALWTNQNGKWRIVHLNFGAPTLKPLQTEDSK